ncbi:MAG: hypothetical protein N3A69_11580, partial [Leptospiraceae bacterium]|nr:hypothetical protein [Leptospiraceae bacterium]
REVYSTCTQILDCSQNGVLRKLVSGFTIGGVDTVQADRFLEDFSKAEKADASGCGCYGTSSCPNTNSVLQKYGID